MRGSPPGGAYRRIRAPALRNSYASSPALVLRTSRTLLARIPLRPRNLCGLARVPACRRETSGSAVISAFVDTLTRAPRSRVSSALRPAPFSTRRLHQPHAGGPARRTWSRPQGGLGSDIQRVVLRVPACSAGDASSDSARSAIPQRSCAWEMCSASPHRRLALAASRKTARRPSLAALEARAQPAPAEAPVTACACPASRQLPCPCSPAAELPCTGKMLGALGRACAFAPERRLSRAWPRGTGWPA